MLPTQYSLTSIEALLKHDFCQFFTGCEIGKRKKIKGAQKYTTYTVQQCIAELHTVNNYYMSISIQCASIQ